MFGAVGPAFFSSPGVAPLTLTAGASASAFGTSSSLPSTGTLSATKTVTIFRETVTPDVEGIVINNPSGTSITSGSPAVAQASSIIDSSLSIISGTKAIACWTTAANAQHAAVLNVSGDVVTPVAPVLINAIGGNGIVVSMSTTQAVMVYANSGIKARVLDISGLDVITAAGAVFSTGLPTSSFDILQAVKIDALKVLVTWRDTGGTGTLRGMVLTLSGSTLLGGSVQDILVGNVQAIGVMPRGTVNVGGSEVICFFGKITTSYLRFISAVVSGTNVSAGMGGIAADVTAIAAGNVSACNVRPGIALVVYTESGTNALKAVTVTTGGGVGPAITLDSNSSSSTSVTALSSTAALCVYRGSTNVLRAVVINF